MIRFGMIGMLLMTVPAAQVSAQADAPSFAIFEHRPTPAVAEPSYGGKPSLAVDNTLDRQFDVAAPDRAWVTDITYIRTLEGFAYLAVVIDLYSRRVVGWSMQSRQTSMYNPRSSATL